VHNLEPVFLENLKKTLDKLSDSCYNITWKQSRRSSSVSPSDFFVKTVYHISVQRVSSVFFPVSLWVLLCVCTHFLF